jgi:hypothetical protein
VQHFFVGRLQEGVACLQSFLRFAFHLKRDRTACNVANERTGMAMKARRLTGSKVDLLDFNALSCF